MSDQSPVSDLSAQSALHDAFDVLCQLTPRAREDWLAAQVADVAQREQLRRLLAAHAGCGFLDTDAGTHVARLAPLEVAPDRLIGQTVGAFRIVRALGQGGMSAVFLGQRDGADFHQQAAIKLLRRGLYSELEQRLFQRERRVLAALEHPNIARLIDGGVTAAGIPYLVMEYIDGVPVTEYADAQNLGVNARVRLFLAVCHAVAAAHHNLIVHRDIKPSNILVTSDGSVKLLDFGIAKLIEERDAGSAGTISMFTPDYAAPEQLRGAAITTATDVYGLGVLLHELLLGIKPSGSPTRRPSSRAHEVDGNAPARLPERARLRRDLRGDLDNILLKALAEEPQRRYPSAGALADDVDNYLAGRAVLAHPPSRLYRAGKFVQRHRGATATTLMLLLAIFIALGSALWQADVAQREARSAHIQAQRAEAVRDLLVGLFDAQVPVRPPEEMPGTAELLARGAQRARTELADAPAVQSDLLTALGKVYNTLGRPQQSIPVLDDAIAAANRVTPADPALLASALTEKGDAERISGHFQRALALLDQAIALHRQVSADNLPLAHALNRRAATYGATGKYAEAVVDHLAALGIRRRQLAPDDPAVLDSENGLGVAYTRAGRASDGEPYLKAAVEAARKHFGPTHLTTANCIGNYAFNQMALHHYAEAAALSAETVRIERAIYPHGDAALVNPLNNLGSADVAIGHLQAAHAALVEASTLNHEAGRGASLGQSYVLGNLARVDQLLGDSADALDQFREAEQVANERVGPDHSQTLLLGLRRARLALANDSTQATGLLDASQRMLAHAEPLGYNDQRMRTEALYSQGLALAALGRDREAGQTLRHAVAELPTDYTDPVLIPAVIALANWQHAHQDAAPAQALLRTAIAGANRDLPPSHYALGELHLALAEMLATSQPREAIKQASAAAKGFAELPTSHPWRHRLAHLQQRLHQAERVSH